uniref:Sodium-dependent phosphate transport protein 2A-like n=2 Tax=Hirondellea gigas TaxID=1518452 RepID=A0A6A7G9M0_9CRUS
MDSTQIPLVQNEGTNSASINGDKPINWSSRTRKGKAIAIGRILFKAFALLSMLYFFIFSLGLMGTSFKVIGGRAQGGIFGFVNDPIAGIMVGILVTVLVQSSSTSTSIVVGLVSVDSENSLTVRQAIPIIMGCNIGTAVTATLVSFIHSAKVDEFRRAFAGAQLNWIYNVLIVIILLVVEYFAHFLEITSDALTSLLTGGSTGSFNSPISAAVAPFVNVFIHADESKLEELAQGVEIEGSLIDDGFMQNTSLSDEGAAALMLVLSLIVMIVALVMLVKLLSSVLKGAAKDWLNKALNFNRYIAMLVGVGVTIMVQSSSITTSTMIPLIGIGVITLEQMLTLTIGANIGTTITALLAALSTDSTFGLQIALVHLLFNIIGMLMLYPIPYLRRIPMKGAEIIGDAVASRRWLSVLHVAGVFVLIPLALLGLSIGDPIALIVGCAVMIFCFSIVIGNLWLKNRRRRQLSYDHEIHGDMDDVSVHISTEDDVDTPSSGSGTESEPQEGQSSPLQIPGVV